jgi:transglutaminase-like putative cysteine protease
MLYELTHTTHYSYEAPVAQCLNEVRITPRAMPGQEVRKTGISVEPAPAFLHHRKDYFGNDVSVFAVFERHDKLTATASSLVEVAARPEVVSSVTWETASAALQAKSDEACLEASEFVYNSPYVPLFPEIAKFARKTFGPGRALVDAVTELNHRIKKEFLYDQTSTSIDSPLPEVLRKKRGVCQDFAHVMIGALRSLRLSARYVSGYVRSGPKFQGAQASHAWVSVFIPDTGWMDFDPTNDLIVSDSHVTLAWGRDYGDVTPVKGVTLGGGGQTVSVEVYMRPGGAEGS